MMIPGKYIAAGSSNQDSQLLKGVPGRLGMLAISNTAAAIRRVKLYDKATAPTSADTPVLTIELPAAPDGSLAVAAASIPVGDLLFGSGIGLRITAGQGDSDAEAASAGDVVVNYAIE